MDGEYRRLFVRSGGLLSVYIAVLFSAIGSRDNIADRILGSIVRPVNNKIGPL